jgi:hypothetical protein
VFVEMACDVVKEENGSESAIGNPESDDGEDGGDEEYFSFSGREEGSGCVGIFCV